MRTIVMTVALWIGVIGPSHADVEKGDTAMAKIMCGIYGGQSEREDDRDKSLDLYLSGIEDLRSFLVAVETGDITAQDLSQSVPVLITLELSGLAISTDFALGRITNLIEHQASDDIHKFNDYDDRNFGENRPYELWPMEAANKFQEKNCGLLDRSHTLETRDIQIAE